MNRLSASLVARSSVYLLVVCAFLLSAVPVNAGTVIVTQNGDAPPGQPLIFGSLRDAIENRASSGDTIVFKVKGQIRLRNDLTIPRDLSNLTLQGKVTIRPANRSPGVLIVEADNVSIDDVTFHDMSLLVSDTRGGVPRRIQGFSLGNSRFRQDIEIDINSVDGCTITDNKIVSSASAPLAAALATNRTSNCVLVRNQITATRDGTWAIRDESSTDLQVIDNPVDKGDVLLSAVSGEVRGNNIGGRIWALRPDFGVANALLTVEDNTAESILAQRTFLRLVHNTLDGTTPGIGGVQTALSIDNDDPAGPQGPIVIERNIITGGRNGITYSETLRGAPAIIHDNEISGCEIRGILVNSAQDVQVTENEVSNCGSNGEGRGIAIGRAGAGELVVENNMVSNIDGTGFLVLPQTTGNSVLLKDNTSKDNTRTGMFLSANSSNLFGLIRLEGNIVTDNGNAGVVAQPNSRAVIIGGEIKNNRASGVRVNTGAKVSISKVSMGANDGAGIDITPDGVTPNADIKNGNDDIDWPESLSIDPVSQKLEGTAAPGSTVELFVVEAGDRLGNPENGEGITFIGSATAAADGSFVYPTDGTIRCPESRLMTLTATLDDGEAVTSEFSTDFDCVIPDDPPPVTDDDGDGVANVMDQCPDTPAGEPADEDGCAESQKDDDDDGVSNTNDQCPATPAGEATNGDGCGESQLDGDGDGVSNADDRCTAPGAPGNSGCPGQLIIPGLGTVYLNDLAESSIASGETGEACNDCSIDLIDNTSHFCFETGGFVIAGAQQITSTDCDVVAPSLTIDGRGSIVSSSVNGNTSCDGGPSQCAVDAEDDRIDGACPADKSCVFYFVPPLLNSAGHEGSVTQVVVEKESVGSDGAFGFYVDSTSEFGDPAQWSINTVGGQGNRIATLYFALDNELTVFEIPAAQWREEVVCYNDVTLLQRTGADSITLDSVLGEEFTSWQCTFTNTILIDTDEDGVPDDEDRCPGPGLIGELGCQKVIGIPGLGTVYLNDESQSTINSGQIGETCSDCLIELEDNTEHSCFGLGSFVIIDTRTMTSSSCDYEAPALAIASNGASITSAVNESMSCEGDSGQCEVTSDNPNLQGSCDAGACIKLFGRTVLYDGNLDLTRVIVSKTSINDDGDFGYRAEVIGLFDEFKWQISTTNRIGDRVAELFFSGDEGLTVWELDEPEWTESVLCSNGTTGDSIGGESVVTLPYISNELFTTWSCRFENTVVIDTDGDGFPDDQDRCSNPGTGGNECPEQGDNGSAAWYCNEPLTCSFTPTLGDCSDCVIERFDATASISCPPSGVCVLRDDRVLQCPAGGCTYETPNLTGSCAPGSLCTHDIGFSCQAASSGNGCDGTFASTSASLSCPAGKACEIEVTPNLITGEASLTAVVDFAKDTENGDGTFDFRWQYLSSIIFTSGLDQYGGAFSIETQGGIGTSIARFYIEPIVGDIQVREVDREPFNLDRIDCDTAAGLEILPESDLLPDEVGGVSAENENSCTFVNIREDAQPDRVELIPDGMVQPDGVSNLAPDAFGGQLNTANPVVGVGTGSSEIFIDVVTGEVPRAGNDRMSFSGTGFASFGVIVQPNEDVPGADFVRSSGAGIVLYQFDPNTGRFGFGQLGFNTIIDLLHLGNDNTSSALLSVNRSVNQIELVSPPDSTGVGNLNQFIVTTAQHLSDVSGELVSAQAYDLGRLDCRHPCRSTGSTMPAGCSAEIDAVLATPGFETCTDFWGSACANEYSAQNGGFCELPASEQQVNFGGNLLVLTDGVPGQIHLGNPMLNFFGRVDTIGDVGNDPRRVRCLAGICAVSNYGSGSLTILTWDGAENAAITDTVTVGDGPIGVDLRQVGDDIVILSTGSNDDTYTKTTVSASGAVISSETQPMLAGCTGPGHIIWVDNSSKAFATCFTSNSYAVFDP